MWKKGLLFLLVLSAYFMVHAQYDTSYSIPDGPGFDRVKFRLNATNGLCSIEPGSKAGVMEIRCRTKGKSQPVFTENINDSIKQVGMELMDKESNYLSSSISKRMFGTDTGQDHAWNVRLSKLKPLDLNLHCTVGDTDIDLSDLPVERLKMRAGSSNVKVTYRPGMQNQLEMDTFLIKVDMGTFDAHNLHLSRCKNILADVGLGKVRMDFGNAHEIHTDVVATVGAGSLEIILPQYNTPVRININNSPLCHITIPKGFEKIEKNVFVTNQQSNSSENYITFSVDVAIGNIEFKTAQD